MTATSTLRPLRPELRRRWPCHEVRREKQNRTKMFADDHDGIGSRRNGDFEYYRKTDPLTTIPPPSGRGAIREPKLDFNNRSWLDGDQEHPGEGVRPRPDAPHALSPRCSSRVLCKAPKSTSQNSTKAPCSSTSDPSKSRSIMCWTVRK